MLKKYLINIKWVICTLLLHPHLTSGCCRVILSDDIFIWMKRWVFRYLSMFLSTASARVKGRELASLELTQRHSWNFFLLGIFGCETEPGSLWNCSQQHTRDSPNFYWDSWSRPAFYPSSCYKICLDSLSCPHILLKSSFCLNQLEVVSVLGT